MMSILFFQGRRAEMLKWAALLIVKRSYSSYGERQLIKGLDAARIEPFLNFTKPSSWYPGARRIKRDIICHVGPTNSGKTYAALQHMVASEGRRIYCAPLRLLAIEMYERLNRQFGVECSLRTGEITCGPCASEAGEDAMILPAGSMAWQQYPATACTVEMADINTTYDVAVIDEVQMMADEQRGWAFTQAVLGIQAKTVYLCGEEASIPLIEKICQETGDSLKVVRFERLSPLSVAETHLGIEPKNVQAGDCVVTFSRRQIFDLKAQIERTTNKKCAVVYGNLPMESRSQQARLFNETGSDYNVLVASDAIGMGLNLNIKRIIFQTMTKYNGQDSLPVASNQVKQIAGRAGRFGTAHEAGVATTFLKKDLAYLKECMAKPNEDLEAAGLLPTADHIVNLAHAFPELGLPAIIEIYREAVTLGDHYFLCQFRDIQKLSMILETFETINMRDRFQLACAPVKTSDQFVLSTFRSVSFQFINPCFILVVNGKLLSGQAMSTDGDSTAVNC